MKSMNGFISVALFMVISLFGNLVFCFFPMTANALIVRNTGVSVKASDGSNEALVQNILGGGTAQSGSTINKIAVIPLLLSGKASATSHLYSGLAYHRQLYDHVPAVTLSSPTGGEFWSGSQSITWNATDEDGDTLIISISYYSPVDSTWHSIATGEANDGSYSWDTD